MARSRRAHPQWRGWILYSTPTRAVVSMEELRSLVRGLDSRVGGTSNPSKVIEIDLATGKPKPPNPLRDALNYQKWDTINGQIDQNGELVEFTWQQLPYDQIRVRIPVSQYAKSKQCKVVVKRNWLYVWAPGPDYEKDEVPEDRPPKVPLLDFQLYGAVDVDESEDWELVDDGAIRNIILMFQKSPAYNWPTLHREGGLKKESDRARVRKEEMEEARKKAEEAEPKEPQYKEGLYASHAGPPRPPVFGPEPDPKAERRRKKAEAKKAAEPDFYVPKQELSEAERKRPPGVYEGGRIIVMPPDPSSSDESD